MINSFVLEVNILRLFSSSNIEERTVAYMYT